MRQQRTGRGYLDYELETRRPSSWKLAASLVSGNCVKNLTGIPSRSRREPIYRERRCPMCTGGKEEFSVALSKDGRSFRFEFVNVSFFCEDHFAAGLPRCRYTFALSNLRILILLACVLTSLTTQRDNYY